jgi:ABC-2 type transport system permease protein
MIRKILAIAQCYYHEETIYPSNFILYTLNRIVEIVVYICVWQAIFSQTGNAGGMTISQMVTYYILVASLRPFALWGVNEEMGRNIRSGQINRELLNPISYFQYYFGKFIGQRFFAVLVSIATFVLCILFWQMAWPANITHFILFLILILLGIPITFYFQMLIGLTAFYTNSIWGVNVLKKALISILSGIIAPITLFPQWFQSLSAWLPFQELIYTPIHVYLGEIPPEQILGIIVKQLLWIFLLGILAHLLFKRASKKITVFGG